MELLIIRGSDAGIAAALRARELSDEISISLVFADEYPNVSICGLPFYVSGETPNWRDLAHRTGFPRIEVFTNQTATAISTTEKIVHNIDSAGCRSSCRHRPASRRTNRWTLAIRGRQENRRVRVGTASRHDGRGAE